MARGSAQEYTAKVWNQGKASSIVAQTLPLEYTAKVWNQGKAPLYCNMLDQLEYTAKVWNQGKAITDMMQLPS